MNETELSRAELRVLDAIDEQTLVSELVNLIRVPSVTGSDAESELQYWHAGQLAALGFDVDTWKLDLGELASHPAYPGTEAPRTEGYGVVGVLGPAGVPHWSCKVMLTWSRPATSTSGTTRTPGAGRSRTTRSMAAAHVT